MTTTEYLQREIRRTELSVRRAERKPNTPPEELRGLHEKLEHLQEALEAVNEHWQRVHEQRGWTAGEPLIREQPADVRPVVRGWWRWVGQDKWNDCYECSQCGKMNTDNSNFCPSCGADMRGESGSEKKNPTPNLTPAFVPSGRTTRTNTRSARIAGTSPRMTPLSTTSGILRTAHSAEQK